MPATHADAPAADLPPPVLTPTIRAGLISGSRAMLRRHEHQLHLLEFRHPARARHLQAIARLQASLADLEAL